MSKKLKTLEQANAEAIGRVMTCGPKPCGIACPTCGKELLQDTSVTLTSNPGQQRVSCVCGFKSTVYV